MNADRVWIPMMDGERTVWHSADRSKVEALKGWGRPVYFVELPNGEVSSEINQRVSNV